MAGPDRSARRLNMNLRQSVNSARTLSFAVTGITGGMNSAANAAGQLAEGIARASRNARIAASATGIGALVAIAVTVGAAFKGWGDQTKDIATRMREVRRETEMLNARGSGDRRLEQELEIAGTLERELAAAKDLESRFRKFPDLMAAIRNRASAAVRAVRLEAARDFNEARFELTADIAMEQAQRQTPADAQRAALGLERQRRINRAEGDATRLGLDAEKRQELLDGINTWFAEAEQNIEHNTLRPLGDQLGRSFAQSIADGISTGIQSGSLKDGFKALTGGLLIGLGDLMQTIGTESLLFANLFQSIISALYSFAPLGAVGPAIALIAAGGILKGLGASMGGRRGGYGGGGSYSGGGYGGGYTQVVDRGLVNPLNPLTGPTPAMPSAPTIFAPIIIGTDDPRAQRYLYDMWKKARARSE